MRFQTRVRRDRGGRRPCGHRGGARGRAHGAAHAAAHAQHRDARADELQSRPSAASARDIWSRRSMRSAASWRWPRMRQASSFARSMRARDRRCARPAPRPTASSTSARSAGGSRPSRICALFQQEVADLRLRNGPRRRLRHVERHRVSARAPWCSPWAPFSAGRIHVGLESHAGGRAGDPPSLALAARLRELPLQRRPAEDRHAAAHRRPQHRLRGPARAAQRRSAAGVLLPRHTRRSTRGRFPATSRRPTSAPTTSSAAPARDRPCSPA